jgi:enolase-phosphatase E1
VAIAFDGRSILLDIEGTIAPISFVYDVLFPYARERLADFVGRHWDEPEVAAVRREIAADSDGGLGAEAEPAKLVEHLLGLMDRDAKTTGLKQVQGLIWKDGFERGELRARVFEDVPPALREWKAAGLDTRIYSSGSVLAQRLFLKHTIYGDLTPLLGGYYDTTTGAKTSAESYGRIAADVGMAPAGVLFVSDVVAELDAAAAAGMRTALAVRPGNKPAGESGFTRITALSEIRLGAQARC